MIERLDNKNKNLWEVFVQENKDAKVQHTLEWKESVEKSYKNCVPYYYLKLEKNEVVAVFPFFLVKSKFFGNRLISQPFLDNGGFIGDFDKNDVKETIILAKEDSSTEIIEIRLNSFFNEFSKESEILEDNGFKPSSNKKQTIIELTNEQEMWKRLHKHTRNDIRKSEKSNLEIKEISQEKEIKEFYKIYINNMKEFGTPQHSYNFFKNIFLISKEKIFGYNCYLKNKPVGSIIVLYTNLYGYVAFNVSNKKYLQYRPNDFLYWTAIKHAIKYKIKYLDLGQVEEDFSSPRSKGWYKFKEKWLGKTYDKVFFGTKESENINKEKLKRFRKIWKRIPMLFIRIIGPKITSQLGN